MRYVPDILLKTGNAFAKKNEFKIKNQLHIHNPIKKVLFRCEDVNWHPKNHRMSVCLLLQKVLHFIGWNHFSSAHLRNLNNNFSKLDKIYQYSNYLKI